MFPAMAGSMVSWVFQRHNQIFFNNKDKIGSAKQMKVIMYLAIFCLEWSICVYALVPREIQLLHFRQNGTIFYIFVF